MARVSFYFLLVLVSVLYCFWDSCIVSR